MPILFLLASLGVINGVLVGAYLAIKRNSIPSDRYFGALLLALCIRIGKSIYFYFNKEADLLILQIGLSACTFIGPLFFLYSKTLLDQGKKIEKKDILFLLALLVTIIAVGIIYPYRTFPGIWNGYIIYGIYSVWLLFVLCGLYYCRKFLGVELFSPSKMNKDQQYVLAIMLAMIFITLTYQAALFIKYTYIWGALIFSFTFYYLMGRMLLTQKPATPRTSTSPLPNASELFKRVDDLMIQEKPFVSQELKLDELAKQAGMTKHVLSRVLNEEYKSGFAQYVKEFRIKEAKHLIGVRPELSLEGIGYEAGFKSKSAFFEAFRKIEKCTPAEYKKAEMAKVRS